MAHGALIESVQHHAAVAVAAVWADARAEAARCRSDADQSIDQLRERNASQLRAVAAAAAQAANADAAKRARAIRSDAKAAVAERARRLAVAALAQFRDASYAGRFAALAGELPQRNWTRIVVNDRDEPLARARFAGCAVAGDTGVIGGVIAEDQALRVNNTFEQRLTAAWPDVLPAVMTDVLDLLRRAQSAA
jgi:vacuolar-type H+-ATPase subunit E/Vma4